MSLICPKAFVALRDQAQQMIDEEFSEIVYAQELV